jgi:hypothetical protein
MPGLYFCGYHVSSTGMLREIALEAKKISASIARKRNLLRADLLAQPAKHTKTP